MCGNLATTRLVRSKHVVIIVINCIARTCFAAAFENSIICVNRSRIIYIEKKTSDGSYASYDKNNGTELNRIYSLTNLCLNM
jgi:hypothetical protein